MITSAKTIAEQFESLGGGSLNLNGWGFGCEFGYWQRSLHLEPLGRLPFTAVRKTPNLIVGYIDHFAPVEGRLDYNPIGWEAVCRAALDVWPTEIQTQRAPSGMDYLALNQPAFQTPPPAEPGARRLSRLRRWLGL